MNNGKNHPGVLRQLMVLAEMDRQALEDKWRDLYGTEPPRFKLSLLQRRLAFRIQELFYGGVETSVKEKLRKIAEEDMAAAKLIRPKVERDGKIIPGTRLIREWNGQTYETIVRDDGFEYNGQMYRSLTAIATAITGTKWNGQIWWGLKDRKKSSENN